ncbi:MAG: dihydrofolate reductase [Proteobacteria bacterium]|nr:dihydrofolate reductase [Pseudomonadota bacterium]
MATKIRVYSAVSLDGFLAGENDELDWLGDSDAEIQGDPGTIDFPSLLNQTGSMLMGRRTFDIVRSFAGPWPYGELPVLVATHRSIEECPRNIRPVSGNIAALCKQAVSEAGDLDVYLDGGELISQALDADLVDEMVLTIVPVFLGRGIPLYKGAGRPRFSIDRSGTFGKMIQVVMTGEGI